MKNYAIAVSIFCLAISIVFGSWFISNGINPNKQNSLVQVQSQTYNRLLTVNQLASYLGITVAEARKLGPIPGESGAYTSVLPNIQIGKKVYFSKAAVDKWLLNNGEATINN